MRICGINYSKSYCGEERKKERQTLYSLSIPGLPVVQYFFQSLTLRDLIYVLETCLGDFKRSRRDIRNILPDQLFGINILLLDILQ